MKRIVLVLLVALLLLVPGLTVQADEEDSVDLEVEVIEPPPEEDKDGRPPTYSMETNLFGLEDSFETDYKGKVQETIEAISEDGNLTITIPEGTIALDDDGKRLRSLEVVVNESPPPPPEDSSVIGLAYDFGPAGATFEPPMTFTWTYNPEDFSGDVAGLTLAYYDEEIGEWIELPCTVDPVARTVTALVSHFTIFAIIGWIPPMPPLPPPIKPEEPEEPTEPEGPIEPEEPAVEEPEVEKPEKPEVTEPEKPSYLWAYILAGVLAVAGLSWLWWIKRRTNELPRV